MPPLVRIEHLSKHFGALRAVDDISFDVQRGEVLGVLGPNGAGKTTTMRMLAGFMPPSAGTASICGHDVQTDGVAARRLLGFLPEGAPVYPDMEVADFLHFTARARGFTRTARGQRVEHAIALASLDDVRGQTIETLSNGYRRRVGLAQALLHDPPVLILDEPTDGLDPNQKHAARALIARLAPDKAIIISTHLLDEVEAVCTRAVIIARGRLIADATPAALRERHPSRSLDAVFRAITAEPAP